MTISSDLVVVGGGVVGAACARALVRAGARVTLITHSGNAGEASRAAAGMLAASLAVAGRRGHHRHQTSVRL